MPFHKMFRSWINFSSHCPLGYICTCNAFLLPNWNLRLVCLFCFVMFLAQIIANSIDFFEIDDFIHFFFALFMSNQVDHCPHIFNLVICELVMFVTKWLLYWRSVSLYIFQPFHVDTINKVEHNAWKCLYLKKRRLIVWCSRNISKKYK